MRAKTIAVLGMISILLIGGVTAVSAHSWQDTVEVGPMELGVSSTPETPVAGMMAEFSGRIADSEVAEGDADRLAWGGVINKSVEVHIRGPDGYHDHLSTSIPEDDAHFHFSYVFPVHGNYSIAIVTELEGEEYSFQFMKEVVLLPARPSGEEFDGLVTNVDHLHENHEMLNKDVDSMSADISDTKSEVGEVHDKVDALSQQVSDLNDQVASLQGQLESQESQSDVEPANAPGFGVIAVLAAFAVAAAFVAGRRL